MNQKETDQQWDRKLHISTGGRWEYDATEYNFPYEPTPYAVLERLAQSGWITSRDHVLDYGCGKGRVCFFLTAKTGCMATGIDISEKLIGNAQDNLKEFPGKERVTFLQIGAEKYEMTRENRLFFFNPFTEKILKSVTGRIRNSREKHPRNILLFFYYPSDEFIACLMTEKDLSFVDEIDCRDLFDGDNPRERILIFEFQPYDH